MTTQNVLNVGLSGQTGTGNFAGSTSPAFITPTLLSPTATTLAFSPTTSGIIGITDGSNSNTGYVGQFVSSVVLAASAISISNASPTNLTSISLGAGDWDLWGSIMFLPTLIITNISSWISSTSATMPDGSLVAINPTNGPLTGINNAPLTPTLRFNVSTTTTIYISGQVSVTSGTCTICGGIYARRRR
jgi:hypothetical protein